MHVYVCDVCLRVVFHVCEIRGLLVVEPSLSPATLGQSLLFLCCACLLQAGWLGACCYIMFFMWVDSWDHPQIRLVYQVLLPTDPSHRSPFAYLVPNRKYSLVCWSRLLDSTTSKCSAH